MKPINQWPDQERPREKLLQRGAAALTDAELLAIFLRTGVQGSTAVDLARDLLERFGGLRKLLAANHEEFTRAKGLGDAKYTQLQACMEMSRRYYYEVIEKGSALLSPEDTRNYLNARLSHYPHEVFACLFLDTRHHVLAFEELFRGDAKGATVHIREVIRRVLEINATAVIFAHNHPSGVKEPSQADKSITERLKEALLMIDVQLLDHFIIGQGRPLSFAEHGWL